MNEERKLAVLQAGIVPQPNLLELARWGVEIPDYDVTEDPREALEDMREAIESFETVEVRSTDLDAMHYFKTNQKVGRLYFSSLAKNEAKKRTSFLEVIYAVFPTGEYLLPWTKEDIHNLMLDEGTYLKPTGEERVYFSDVHELFLGERKVFMVCTPAPVKQ